MLSFLRSTLDLIPLSATASQGAPVLTYHATYSTVPSHVNPTDNVRPGTLHRQLTYLKKFYRFVSIDEFCAAKHRRGLSTVTFDDGYKCVFEQASPILCDLDIPFTVFVNINAEEQRAFWRHKVWFIITKRLVAECESSFKRTKKIANQPFDRYLKDPSNNSEIAEAELDTFLASRGITLNNQIELVNSANCLPEHPLISYGNHTARHYVLSSLPFSSQLKEIDKTRQSLASRKGLRLSEVFALPFGELQHVNSDTFRALRTLGYKHILMNRNRLNRNTVVRDGVEVIERIHVMDAPISWQIKSRAINEVLHRSRIEV